MILGEHRQRLITGGVLALVLGLCVWFGGRPMQFLALAVALVALFEFYSLFWPGKKRPVAKGLGLAMGAGVVLSHGYDFLWPALFLLVPCFLAGLLFLFSYGLGEKDAKLGDFSPLVFGGVYIPLVLYIALGLSPLEQLLCVLAAIATDAGGYYAGCRFGKHKMWPAVSPKKSWEGAIGGLLLCAAVCVCFGLVREYAEVALPALPLPAWVAVGVALNLAAQLGDFFESALKRTQNVKDSGTILPGHGGLLDRIDSLLFVLPVFLAIRQLAG